MGRLWIPGRENFCSWRSSQRNGDGLEGMAIRGSGGVAMKTLSLCPERPNPRLWRWVWRRGSGWHTVVGLRVACGDQNGRRNDSCSLPECLLSLVTVGPS